MTEKMAQYEASPKKEVKERIIRIKLVDGTKINGRVNINRNDGFNRVSDLVVGDREPFLILVDATVNQEGLDNPVRHKTMFVNKKHILWATPEENQK